MLTFSIVIPTSNEEDELPKLLASVKTQTIRPERLVVADAFSTDRTRELAESWGALVVDGGMPGVGRNRGAEHVSSDLIVFLDADVILREPDFLERMVREMDERRIDLGTVDVLPESGKRLDRLFHAFYNRYVRLLERVHPHAPGFCMVVRRHVHEAVGGFDETVTFCEDHDYALRVSRAGYTFRFLSLGIPTSTRRLERDGHLSIAVKYILAEFHLWVLGPIRHRWFNYTFGHKKDKDLV
ncbi:MAG: Glycosyl transferase family 2 [Parcubacteria group bacterium GW2011_GWA2_56_7]|nr:MAG: Glycosyl transferase family 2 [Parcubacteria group bacterium GW2011_GWA2_56_7]